jgi:NitT/TauT family transport system ATP-binding protein
MSSATVVPSPDGEGAPAVPLISVRNLSKSFSGPGGRPLPVLEDINLDVVEGEFVALLGRSGSGKSTLLRCIAGLMAPSEGEVLFRGEPLTGTNRETAMVFQTFALMPWLTVQQNVELGLEARGVSPGERSERALRAIDIVGLDGYESAFPKELSGGMRQRVGFARALVVEPAALLMDEPFSALDVLTSENLRGELLELWEGHKFPTKTIVMVTHNIEEAALLADRILVLGTSPGRIRYDLVNPLARPRRRRTPDFDEFVDQIYRMMTQREAAAVTAPAAPGAQEPGTISDTPLPQATVDGLSGLAEILIGRHSGAADLADLAEGIGLEVDDLLPLVDALVLLGFAVLQDDRLELTGNGQVFAGASIQDSKEIFARACLSRAPLVRAIYRNLRATQDDSLPAGYFIDILRARYSEEESARQLDVAINWGRYAELYDYDAARGQIIREEQGIGATIADAPEPVHQRGSLTVYLGAAPGAGKTYTMLREGRARRAQGEDVVIGFADTRGRPHTEEAIGGLEVVPAREVERTATEPEGGEEMDVTAVLARHPQVALVDDLGMHATAISALRAAGIDVVSTADIGDVRAVADQWRAITGHPAPARISDDQLANIDATQFVDSSPEALRKRLGHGNIYPAERVPEVLRTEFQPARLAALRELGLGLVARSAPEPDAARQRHSQDVLVALSRPELADSLVLRGIRLARRRGATCYVLTLSASGQPPVIVSEQVRQTAEAAGVIALARDSRDVGAAIISAVQEAGARHLVLAAPAVGLLERWRGSLIERLVGRLPDVHLHVLAASSPAMTAMQAAGTLPGEADQPEQRRGAVRVYLGYAPGCGTTTAMLDEAARRQSRGTDVVIGAVDVGDREQVAAELEGLELIGDGSTLDTDAVLARRPEVVCVDDLTGGTRAAERRFAAARRLTEAGITVVGTVQLGDLGSPFLDEHALLALADEIELVDVAPSILIDRVKRGEIVPADQVAGELATTYRPEALQAARERAFALVTQHSDRRLARYAADRQLPAPEAPPCILACVAPRPGMEPLLRRSASLAAEVDGRFLAAVVRAGEPGDEEDALLEAYAALTAQLGGELTEVNGPSPATVLAGFAERERVTEMILGRSVPNPAGRRPVLRELVKVARDTEMHVLPAGEPR